MEEKPKRTGRPAKDPARLKKGRTLSFTDAEYKRLEELAAAAKVGVSEYVILKCGLAQTPSL
ncbi:hypothetical protein [Hymenobacter mucosus]|uniref:Ribbon-helix-helix protein, copG family n=1 Tax=Hymenobacter mucosus TaxID=1411120 RepID=A0A239ACF6_9BACT|nr:hypothetical protein [Hymenobacter mucosus]SNR92563.1 hypothetical protein SAMN06269173_111107 [Hymenobacter mucosus]